MELRQSDIVTYKCKTEAIKNLMEVLKGVNPIYYYLLVLVVSLMYFIFKSAQNLPPGPLPWPIIGNILSLGNKPHISLAQLAAVHGPLISLRLGTQLLVVGSSTNAAKEIFRTHDKVLSGRCVPHAVPVSPDRLHLSMAWSDCTDQWKFLRTLVRTEVFSPKTIEAQASMREMKVNEMMELLRTKEGQMVSIGELTFDVVFNMLSVVFVSKNFLDLYGESTKELKEKFRHIMELFSAPNLADYFKIFSGLDLQGLNRKTNKIRVRVSSLWEATVKERMNIEGKDASRQRDLLDGLLKRGLLKDQIDYLFMELFLAGTDTTSSTVEWTLSELIKNPEVMEKVLTELKSEVKESVVKESDLPFLPYLHYVVKESLRLHPPAPFLLPRRALETCKVMNYTIPRDTQVFINAWAIGRDPENWEDPMSFKPERFLGTSLEPNTGDYRYLAFGSGRRICPGLPMASKEIPLIIASLLKCFDWSLPHGMIPTELDMEESFSLTLNKAKPLVLIPKIKVNSA